MRNPPIRQQISGKAYQAPAELGAIDLRRQLGGLGARLAAEPAGRCPALPEAAAAGCGQRAAKTQPQPALPDATSCWRARRRLRGDAQPPDQHAPVLAAHCVPQRLLHAHLHHIARRIESL